VQIYTQSMSSEYADRRMWSDNNSSVADRSTWRVPPARSERDSSSSHMSIFSFSVRRGTAGVPNSRKVTGESLGRRDCERARRRGLAGRDEEPALMLVDEVSAPTERGGRAPRAGVDGSAECGAAPGDRSPAADVAGGMATPGPL
jgi:hypothetical protein